MFEHKIDCNTMIKRILSKEYFNLSLEIFSVKYWL